MKKLIFICLILCFSCSLSFAANHYIRAGATGTGTGADWTNAYTNLPVTLIRGDTYYIAEGSYGSYTFANTAGTNTITVKKCPSSTIMADSCQSVAGWNDSYGDGQSVFTYWDMRMSYLTIDGQTGGGSGSWTTGHGIAVRNLASHLVYSAASYGTINNLTLKHIELDGVSNANADRDAIYMLGGATNLTLQYMNMHNIACDVLQLRGNFTNITLEYSYVADTTSLAAGCHGDVFEFDTGTMTNFIARYNWVNNCENSYIWGTHENGIINGLEIYGNIVTGGFSTNGVVSALSGGGTISNLKFYNNTVANMVHATHYAGGFGHLRGTNNVAYNNIWYNAAPVSFSTATHNYNWFYLSGSQSETNIQNGTGDPFINSASNDYRLAIATNSGTSLPSPYNTDMLGNTRGADGTWDRGAYDYGTSDVGAPSSPSNLRILSN